MNIGEIEYKLRVFIYKTIYLQSSSLPLTTATRNKTNKVIFIVTSAIAPITTQTDAYKVTQREKSLIKL